MVQEPDWQAISPFAPSGQARPQPPQFATSVWVSDSQPFWGFLSQSPNQPLQAAGAHCPARQAMLEALGRGPQLEPQAPQLAESLATSTSQPLTLLPSQS